jgi:hypothetical protein
MFTCLSVKMCNLVPWTPEIYIAHVTVTYRGLFSTCDNGYSTGYNGGLNIARSFIRETLSLFGIREQISTWRRSKTQYKTLEFMGENMFISDPVT